MGFGIVDWALLALYLVLMVAVGVYFKTTDTLSDYTVADSKLDLSVLSATLLATAIGGGALIGNVGASYSSGIIMLPQVAVLTLINLFMGVFVAKKVRSIGGFTAPEMLGRVYGKRCQALGGIFCGIYMIGTGPAMQSIGLGTCIHLLLGVDLRLAMIIGMAIILFYTFSSGMWGVVMTDYIQYIFLSLGVILVAIFVYQDAGGWTNIAAHLPPKYLQVNTTNMLRLVCSMAFPVMIDGNRYARFFSAKDADTARKATLIAVIPQTVNNLLLVVIGLAAVGLIAPNTPKDMVFSTLLMEYLPAGIKGLCVAALMAAIMSTADSYMLTGATNFSVDIYKTYINPNATDKQMLKVTKYGSLTVGLVGLGWAILFPDVVGIWTLSATAYVAGCLVPMLYGMFSSGKKSYLAATISMIGGGAVALICDINHIVIFNLPAIVYGIIISAILLLVITQFASDAKYVDIAKGKVE